jgi:pSer/pThr/pTyr-binding forkhead associated (FHA) protein
MRPTIHQPEVGAQSWAGAASQARADITQAVTADPTPTLTDPGETTVVASSPARPSAARTHLRVVRGPTGDGGHLPLEGETATVGRDGENDVVLESKSVSRFHCRITSSNGSRWIEDLNSANGTRVNGDEVRDSVPLRDRDVIRIGEWTLEYRDRG